jgi:CubicO group peptidase (beta-lactamase class C family)
MRRWIAVWLTPAVLGTSALSGQTRGTDSERLLRSYARENSVPGIGIAVAVDGEIVFAGSVGFADLELRVPVDANTLFRTASVLKPMTAAAVLMLAVADSLNLDEPIQSYCPVYPTKRWPVTARPHRPHGWAARFGSGGCFQSQSLCDSQRSGREFR